MIPLSIVSTFKTSTNQISKLDPPQAIRRTTAVKARNAHSPTSYSTRLNSGWVEKSPENTLQIQISPKTMSFSMLYENQYLLTTILVPIEFLKFVLPGFPMKFNPEILWKMPFFMTCYNRIWLLIMKIGRTSTSRMSMYMIFIIELLSLLLLFPRTRILEY